MRYKRYQDIEQRLVVLLGLIRSGRQTTRTLARELRASRPTISRDIGALYERGYAARAVRDAETWAYELTGESVPSAQRPGVSQQ
jgi:predicted DNA-binding transcriptional regulator YafY